LSPLTDSAYDSVVILPRHTTIMRDLPGGGAGGQGQEKF
jgi:hypothetical protein